MEDCPLNEQKNIKENYIFSLVKVVGSAHELFAIMFSTFHKHLLKIRVENSVSAFNIRK